MQTSQYTVGLFRLPDSRASGAITAMVEKIHEIEGVQKTDQLPIVFIGHREQDGVRVPSMLVIDLFNRATYVSLDGFVPICTHQAPAWAIKRARKLSKMLLRQYLSEQKRSGQGKFTPKRTIAPAFRFAQALIQA